MAETRLSLRIRNAIDALMGKHYYAFDDTVIKPFDEKIPRQESKKNPYTTMVGYGDSPQYALENYGNYYQEGYNENSLVYAAISYKSKAITQAKLTAYKHVLQTLKFITTLIRVGFFKQ